MAQNWCSALGGGGGRYSYTHANQLMNPPTPLLPSFRAHTRTHASTAQVTKANKQDLCRWITWVNATATTPRNHDTRTLERHTPRPPFKCSHTRLTAINTLQATMLTPPTHGMGRQTHGWKRTSCSYYYTCTRIADTRLSTNTPSKHWRRHTVSGDGQHSNCAKNLRLPAPCKKTATRQASHPHPRASKPSPGQKLSRAQARACQLFKTSQGPTTGLPALAAWLVARGRECPTTRKRDGKCSLHRHAGCVVCRHALESLARLTPQCQHASLAHTHTRHQPQGRQCMPD